MFDFHPAEVPLSITMCTNLQPIRLFSGRFSRINLHIFFFFLIYFFAKSHLTRADRIPGPGRGGKRDGGEELRADLSPLPPLFGGVSSLFPSCTLPSSPPVPSPLSLPILAPSLSPQAGRSPCLVLRERGRESFGKSHKEFSSERERSGQSSGVIHRKQRCSGHQRPPTRPGPLG